MKVFKFGGASVNTSERIRNVADILKRHQKEKILVVISAMGKTTNALEKVVEAYFAGEKAKALQLFESIRNDHLQISEQLGKMVPQQTPSAPSNPAKNFHSPPLDDFFTEVEWLLHDHPVRTFDYYYDQVVCAGELLSTTIVSRFLNEAGVENQWVDVRDIIRTDDNFRNAKVDWEFTEEKVNREIKPLFQRTNFVLTQGFIGATDENESTTLGREGSDYTASIFANMLDAESLTIWKDVKGVMNADPKQYASAQWIRELNYREVIEMAYYGAQVIHPKTIKPLQNKNIPMYVRSFTDPGEEGTCIRNKNISSIHPIIVYKHDQVLLELRSRDFSFVGEGLTSTLYSIFDQLKFQPNLTQNAAISFLCVVDEQGDKAVRLAQAASEVFDVQVVRDLTLLTIRHYNADILQQLCRDCEIILKQQTPETVQVLLRKTAEA